MLHLDQSFELFLSSGNSFFLIPGLFYFPFLINGICLRDYWSVVIKESKGNRYTQRTNLWLVSSWLNFNHLNSTASNWQRRLTQDLKCCLETTFTCAPRVLQVISNVNKNIFWWWKPLQSECIVIKIGTRINCAVFFFVRVLIQKQFSPKSDFRIIIFVEKILYMKRRGVTVWVSDLVLDLSGRANMWKCSCLPVHLENCPLKIIANGAVWSSLIFLCNIFGHWVCIKDTYPRFQSKLGRNKNINLSNYNFT